MKTKYDFSKGVRGKFYNPEAEFSFPIYLDSDVNEYLSKLADEKDMDIQQLVNEWLRANINVITHE